MNAGSVKTHATSDKVRGTARMSRRGLLALRSPNRSMVLAGVAALRRHTRNGDEDENAATACFHAMVDEAINALGDGAGLPPAMGRPYAKDAAGTLGIPLKNG